VAHQCPAVFEGALRECLSGRGPSLLRASEGAGIQLRVATGREPRGDSAGDCRREETSAGTRRPGPGERRRECASAVSTYLPGDGWSPPRGSRALLDQE